MPGKQHSLSKGLEVDKIAACIWDLVEGLVSLEGTNVGDAIER